MKCSADFVGKKLTQDELPVVERANPAGNKQGGFAVE
jgi:hypothetical protein